MSKARTLSVAVLTSVAVLLTAIPASAYYITGWQTNSGWNSLDGCKVSRNLYSDHVFANDYFCGRDVGVRSKGTYNAGGAWEFTSIAWDSSGASQSAPFYSYVGAMKVYHGNH
jgi:hypothetical protein